MMKEFEQKLDKMLDGMPPRPDSITPDEVFAALALAMQARLKRNPDDKFVLLLAAYALTRHTLAKDEPATVVE